MMACEDEEVERLAIHYVGKYYGRKGGRGVKAGGGLVSESEDKAYGISLKSFTAIRVREGGAEWLCYQAIEELGLVEYLSEELGMPKSEVDMAVLNLLGRLIYPTSERKTALWLAEQSSALELSSVRARAAHDKALGAAALSLLEHHEAIEDYLYGQLDERLGFEGLPFLYDLTNTYFEGRMLGCELARHGRSKEKRSDCPLVSIGLLSNAWGFLRRTHFYAGNVSEPGTLNDVVSYIQAHNGIITDAGIATEENILALAKDGLAYLCVVRQGFGQYEASFEEAYCFEHSCSNGSRYKVWLEARQHSFKVDGQELSDTLIFVKSEQKQAKEDSIIRLQKQRFEKGLEAIQQSLSKPRGHKKVEQVHQRIGRLRARHSRVSKAFHIQAFDDGQQVQRLEWNYDAALEQRNGTYVIRTSMPVESPQQVWQAYHALSNIEAVNRCCKTDLNMRPVYHQKDSTVKAHLFLTLLACTIVQYIRHRLAAKGIRHSWKEIIRIMNTHKTVLARFSNEDNEAFLLSQWSAPEGKAQKVYDALGYKYQPYGGFFFKITAPGKCP
jgi:transposase